MIDRLTATAAARAKALTAAIPYTQVDTAIIQYDPHASKVLEKDFWRVIEPFKFYLPDDPELWVYIPAGYLTDGATVPQPFWMIVPPWGNHGQAAVIHDILCECAIVYRDHGDGHVTEEMISREDTDRVFLKAMELADVGWIKRRLMYFFVRAYSMLKIRPIAWRREKKRELEVAWRRAHAQQDEGVIDTAVNA